MAEIDCLALQTPEQLLARLVLQGEGGGAASDIASVGGVPVPEQNDAANDAFLVVGAELQDPAIPPASGAAGNVRRVISDLVGRLTVLQADLNYLFDTVSTTRIAVAASAGLSPFRTAALTSTAQLIKASSGNLYRINLINVNTTAVYLKFYNSSSPTVGTTVPLKVFAIPAGDSTNPGALILDMDLPVFFSSAISVACVTGLADSNTTAPTTAVYCEAAYA